MEESKEVATLSLATLICHRVSHVICPISFPAGADLLPEARRFAAADEVEHVCWGRRLVACQSQDASFQTQFPAATQSFAKVAEHVRRDMYLHPHLRHYIREVRVVVYTQVRVSSVARHLYGATCIWTVRLGYVAAPK